MSLQLFARDSSGGTQTYNINDLMDMVEVQETSPAYGIAQYLTRSHNFYNYTIFLYFKTKDYASICGWRTREDPQIIPLQFVALRYDNSDIINKEAEDL